MTDDKRTKPEARPPTFTPAAGESRDEYYARMGLNANGHLNGCTCNSCSPNAMPALMEGINKALEEIGGEATWDRWSGMINAEVPPEHVAAAKSIIYTAIQKLLIITWKGKPPSF